MERVSILLKELCLEIATGDIAGEKFGRLLLETGVQLSDSEWDAANRVLTQSECMFATCPVDELTLH
ncbi:MAG: hypothetical protein A3I75_00585 [Deltaproteobacteria bacterium RIFCSPLOWO2_02_FULL_50_16]|nr:MAG: hypothetical protein A2053_02200 [Deltaproteobacteria bacterium GWA2_50_8]OGQ55842.1 MAG: hypothetical protein A3I75_00585 [Deltaproteobacteria bacterium RIFCSPLOWO2_02_FULL_50_16]OGQ67947.1 MAG: hypothetical protein A3F89_03465 [Deltaproteobacteria bacterium RIFCSPLOWO2_12_FULL_50_11]